MKIKTIAAACGIAFIAQGAFADSYAGMKVAELQSQLNALQNQVNHMGHGMPASASNSMLGMVSTNAPLSMQLNGDRQLTGQDMMILDAAKAGKLASGLTLGGMLQGDVMYAKSAARRPNNSSAFNNAYFDDTGLSSAENRSAVTLTNYKISALANINKWTSAFVQLGQFYPGSTPNNSPRGLQDSSSGINVQQAYLLIGNLAQSPFYGFVGQRYIDFGQFTNVNPFTQPLTRQFFQSAGDTIGAGIQTHGINATLSFMNGGSQNKPIYMTNGVVSQNLYTKNNSEINNFALNVGYGQSDANNVKWHIGAGYLNGGSSAIAAVDSTTNPTLQSNPIADLNAALTVGNWDFVAEYDYAFSRSAVYNGNNADSQQLYTPGAHGQAYQLAGDYRFSTYGMKSMASMSFSQAKNVAHADTTLSQYVLGYSLEPVKNVWAGLEYAYQSGVAGPTTSNGSITFNGNGVTNQNVTLDVKAFF